MNDIFNQVRNLVGGFLPNVVLAQSEEALSSVTTTSIIMGVLNFTLATLILVFIVRFIIAVADLQFTGGVEMAIKDANNRLRGSVLGILICIAVYYISHYVVTTFL